MSAAERQPIDRNRLRFPDDWLWHWKEVADYFRAWNEVERQGGLVRDINFLSMKARVGKGEVLAIKPDTTYKKIDTAVNKGLVLQLQHGMTAEQLEQVMTQVDFVVNARITNPRKWKTITVKTDHPALFRPQENQGVLFMTAPILDSGPDAEVKATYCLQYARLLGISEHEAWQLAKSINRLAYGHVESVMREGLLADYRQRVWKLGTTLDEDPYASQVKLDDVSNWQVFARTIARLGELNVLWVGGKVLGVGANRSILVARMETAVLREMDINNWYTVGLDFYERLAGSFARGVRSNKGVVSEELKQELVDVVGLFFKFDPKVVNWLQMKIGINNLLQLIGTTQSSDLARELSSRLGALAGEKWGWMQRKDL